MPDRIKNILVTGSNGQLGNEMRLLGASSSNRYLFTDVAELDITDCEAVRAVVAANHIEVIVNCAAYTNVEKAEEDFATADLINHTAAGILAEAAKQVGATLLHVSTDYVFQGDRNTPCQEEWETNPLGAYGTTKLLGEKAIEQSGCKALIFRTAWLYSAFGNNFVKTMLRLTAERESLKVVFDQVGTPTYAADLAQVLFTLIEQEKYVGNEGIYHFSNEGVCSWYDFAHEIAALSGHTACRIEPCYSAEFPSKVKRPHFSVLDKTKLKTTFELEVPYWRDSLQVCLSHLLKQQ